MPHHKLLFPFEGHAAARAGPAQFLVQNIDVCDGVVGTDKETCTEQSLRHADVYARRVPSERDVDIDCLIRSVIDTVRSGDTAAMPVFHLSGASTSCSSVIAPRYRRPPTSFLVKTR
ncbi:hypothetical protein rerp_58900 [Rhodococcus erythropolis]|nr:hypothetical protein rerp_58900 [Rhodococcus erythropolis]